MAETTPPKKVSEINISSCRCCNSDTDAHHRVPFFGKKSSDEGITDAIKQLTGIIVSKEDNLFHFVCRICARLVTNLHKKVKEFRSVCVATERKQIDKLSSIREKRLRRDDFDEHEKSPLPLQPRKKSFVEKRVAQNLERRIQKIAPRPESSLSFVLLPSSTHSHLPDRSEVQMASVNDEPQPSEPTQTYLNEVLEIISKSGLLGYKVRT